MSMNTYKKQEEEMPEMDFNKLVNTPEFRNLTKRKSKFLRISFIFFCFFFTIMPLLTAYTNILEKRAIGYITWTWIYAFGIFVMVWALSIIYTRKAAKFDKDVEKILLNKFSKIKGDY